MVSIVDIFFRESFYGDYSNLVNLSNPWGIHGGVWYDGNFDGLFYYSINTGARYNGNGSRLVIGNYNITVLKLFYR